jgi:UDP-GlcNAc:undecaprenyl-phosphate GlcNAc-1-phosphate transferase
MYAVILILPWLVALVLTPLVIRWAAARGWLDHPRGRKNHPEPVPVLGGVAVFGAVMLGLLLAAPFSMPIRAGFFGSGSLLALAGGVAAILVLGAYDDRHDLRASLKLAAQVAIAALTWFLGFRCGAVELPLGWVISDSAVPSFVVTVSWIVIVTNAFNLIDGLDGLAAGIGIVATLTIFMLAAGNEATVPVVGALALAGALSGFLRYNVPPARIFLGDAGAMGIGYTTAVLSLASYQKAPTAVVLIVPLLALGVPLLDTIVAVMRRAGEHLRDQGRNGFHPIGVSRAVFRADRGHIHHLLLRLGWSVRRVLFLLYAISAGLSVLGLWTRSANPDLRWAIWLSLLLVGVVALRLIERSVKRKERERAGDAVNFRPPVWSASDSRRKAG